jgi:hypothetical protein
MTYSDSKSGSGIVPDIIILSLSGTFGSLSAALVLEWIGIGTRMIIFPLLLIILFMPVYSLYVFLFSFPFGKWNEFRNTGIRLFLTIKAKVRKEGK